MAPRDGKYLGISIRMDLMIHITLGSIEQEDPAADPLGRSHHGWRPGMTDEDCYESNRGRWVLGARADRERYALLSATDEARKVVVLAIEMDGPPQDTGGGRRALSGRILRPGHRVYDRYVGGDAPVRGPRNPVTYFESPLDTQVLCGCGCGEIVPLYRDFLPGHDQRAIHERIARVGGVREFLNWFDKEPPGRPAAP
jgi:hypothetical protein